jgi:hypothetical protein
MSHEDVEEILVLTHGCAGAKELPSRKDFLLDV